MSSSKQLKPRSRPRRTCGRPLLTTCTLRRHWTVWVDIPAVSHSKTRAGLNSFQPTGTLSSSFMRELLRRLIRPEQHQLFRKRSAFELHKRGFTGREPVKRPSRSGFEAVIHRPNAFPSWCEDNRLRQATWQPCQMQYHHNSLLVSGYSTLAKLKFN